MKENKMATMEELIHHYATPVLCWSNPTEIRNSALIKPWGGSGSAERWMFLFIQKIKYSPPHVWAMFQLSPALLTWVKWPLPYEQHDSRPGHYRTGQHKSPRLHKILANGKWSPTLMNLWTWFQWKLWIYEVDWMRAWSDSLFLF